MKAVGLTQYSDRMAEKLSGGNKRKLSLGIALMGNPSVLLLDEPSSGMDAASKRVMWKTLASVVPGRSLVLTTHSMEEADALATRAGILSSRMLALGTTDYLRRKHGDAYYVHLVHTNAPHSSTEEMDQIRSWVETRFPDADIERQVYGGQLRFTLPIHHRSTSVVVNEQETGVISRDGDEKHHLKEKSATTTMTAGPLSKNTTTTSSTHAGTSIAVLFATLEEEREHLGISHYSVSRSTLDQVFLAVCGKASVLEEGERALEEKKTRKWLKRG